MNVNKPCVFHCSKSKTIHGGTPIQTIISGGFRGGRAGRAPPP